MGIQDVKDTKDQKHLNQFIQHLLTDVEALEKMINEDWFEKNITRIGAEQEFCLIDENFRPAMDNLKILETLQDERFTTELAKFNAEINVTPLTFEGTCLSEMEKEIVELTEIFRDAANKVNDEIIFTGILPTIRRFDVEMESLTPIPRYFALMEAINNLRGNAKELKINGIDELILLQDSPLLEACNTGFQVHLQVSPEKFAKMYNIAQVIAGPVLAFSVNSPVLLGKRLWHETRIALFQQSIDTRHTGDHLRESSPRVTFGHQWLKDSILEIYKEDIVRYRAILSTDIEENVLEKLKNGVAPKLKALNVHNSTVYRWNRPCYGVSPNGKPHLRIENRIFPAGPSITDSMANAAFWLGLMIGMDEKYDDVTKLMDFDEAKANFMKASISSLDSSMYWFDDKKISTKKLILEELLPLARKGLQSQKISKADIDYYLGIIEKRVSKEITGSAWMLKSYTKLAQKKIGKEEAMTTITESIVNFQKSNIPVHEWEYAEVSKSRHERHPRHLHVEEFMTKDLFTCQKDDPIAYVAKILDWQKIRYMPVENEHGELIGLVTLRNVMRSFAKHLYHEHELKERVENIMIENPITIEPSANITDAIEIMAEHGIGSLPVVKNKKLIGIVTEKNIVNIAQRLFVRLNKSEEAREVNSEKQKKKKTKAK